MNGSMHAIFGIYKLDIIINQMQHIKIFTVACPSGVTVLETNISASKVCKDVHDQETFELANAG